MHKRILLTLWLLVVVVALSVNLGGYPLLDADEGRNAEVGREMAATNDYVMPRLDGLPYLDKPIVYFAAEAALMEILGPTEIAARLPALLFTLLTAAVLAWFARRLGVDPLVAAIVFLSTPLTLAFARTVIFDSALTLFITIAMAAFYIAVEQDRKWSIVAWAAIGIGVITKGPVAIAVPLIVAIPYAAWRRRSHALWSLAGLMVFILAIAPWVWAISRAVPDFLHYVVVTETAQRLATPALKRAAPFWYFVPFLVGGALPWSIAAIPATWSRLSRRLEPESEPGESRLYVQFLLLWIAVPFLFFSLSQSKRPQYILPLMPAIALLVARRWRGSRAAAVTMAALGGVVLAAPFVVRLRPEYADAARRAAIILGLTAVVCGVLALNRRFALIALTIPVLAIPLVTNPLMNVIAARRSEKAFVAQLPAGEVIGIEAFTGSMAFYLERPIIVVSPDGEEFTSNYIIRHYGAFANAAGSPLRSMSWLPNALDASRRRVLIVRDSDTVHRALIEGRGGRLIATSAHFAAYTMPR